MIDIKWGKNTRDPNNQSFVSYKLIGKLYGIDGSSARRLIMRRFDEINNRKIMTRRQRQLQEALPIRQKYGYRFLREEHIQYLKSHDTLDLWAGKSLKERCLLFHRHFGNHRINPTLLRYFYRLHKVKSKRIKQVKLIDPDKETHYEEWRLEIKDKIQKLKDNDFRIIYLDECVFTSKTLKTTDYTPLKSPHRIPQVLINQPVYALILAISEENGLEYYEIFEKSVDHYKFNQYLDELYIANKHESIAIFADNMKVHQSNPVTEKLIELGIQIVFNVPYQPDYNPAESCLSKIKNYYKRQKLNRLVNNEDLNLKQLINDSVNQLSKQDIVNCIQHSQFLLNK